MHATETKGTVCCAGKLWKALAGLFWSGVGALILTVASWARESAFARPLVGAGLVHLRAVGSALWGWVSGAVMAWVSRRVQPQGLGLGPGPDRQAD